MINYKKVNGMHPQAAKEMRAYYKARYPDYDIEGAEMGGVLHRVQHLLAEASGTYLNHKKLSGPLLKVLMLLQSSGPLALSELGKKLDVSKANVTWLVDQLQEEGLVSRTDDTEDRRYIRACITSAGEQVLAEVLPAHFSRQRALYTKINGHEKRLLLELLLKLHQSIETADLTGTGDILPVGKENE